MLNLDLRTLHATPGATRPAGIVGDGPTGFVRVLGLFPASVMPIGSDPPVHRWWAMGDDGGKATAGGRLRVPVASAAFLDSDPHSELEELPPGIPDAAYQDTAEGRAGHILLRAGVGQREVYVSDRPFLSTADFPEPGAPLPRNVQRYVVQVYDGETTDLDASEMVGRVYGPAAPATAAPTTGVLGVDNLEPGWTVWVDESIRATNAQARDGRWAKVGTAAGGTTALTVKAGRWNENPSARVLQARSPDGATAVDYGSVFSVQPGGGAVVDFAPALNAWSVAHGGTLVSIQRPAPVGWSFFIDGAPMPTYEARVLPGAHVVRATLDGWNVSAPDVRITVGSEPVIVNVRTPISSFGLGALAGGRAELGRAVSETLAGRLPGPPPAAPAPPPATPTAPAALRLAGPAGWLVGLYAVGAPEPIPGAVAVLPIAPPGIVPVPVGRYDLGVLDPTGRTARRTIDVPVGGLRVDVTDFLPALPVARPALAVTGPAGWLVGLYAVGAADPIPGAVAVLPIGPVPVDAGRYDLATRDPSGRTARRTIDVPAGGLRVDVTDFLAPLAAATGRVAVVGAPATWPRLLDGAVVAPSALDAVAAGTHAVAVRPPTGADLALTVSVPAGGAVNADFTSLVAAMPPPPAGDDGVGRIMARNVPDGWRLERARRVTRVVDGQTQTSQMPYEATTVELLSRGVPSGEWALRAVSPDGARQEERIVAVPASAGSVEVSFAPVGSAPRAGIDLRGVADGFEVRVTRSDTSLAVPVFTGGSAQAAAGLAALQTAGPGHYKVVLVETAEEMDRRLGPQPSEAARAPGSAAPPRYPDQPITTMPLGVDVPADAVVVVDVSRDVAAARVDEQNRLRAWLAAQVTTGTVTVTGIPVDYQRYVFVLRAPFVVRDGHNVRGADWEYPLLVAPAATRGAVEAGAPAIAVASVPQGFYSLEVAETNLPLGTCSPVGGVPATDPRCAPWVAASVEVRVGQDTPVAWSDLAALRGAPAAQQPIVQSPQPGVDLKTGETPAAPLPLGTYVPGRATVYGVPRGWLASVTQTVPPGGMGWGAALADGGVAFDFAGGGQLLVSNKSGANALTVGRPVSPGDVVQVGRAVADLVYTPGRQPLGLGITGGLPDGRKAGFLAPEFANFAASVLTPGAFDREVAEFDELPVAPAHAAELAGKVLGVLYAPGRGFGAFPLTAAQLATARQAVAGAQFGDEAFLDTRAGTVAKVAGVTVVAGGVGAALAWAWTWFRSGRGAAQAAVDRGGR